jgi:hypothetical protein
MNLLLALGGAFVALALSLFLLSLDYVMVKCIYESIRDDKDWIAAFFFFLGFCIITGFILFLLSAFLG